MPTPVDSRNFHVNLTVDATKHLGDFLAQSESVGPSLFFLGGGEGWQGIIGIIRFAPFERGRGGNDLFCFCQGGGGSFK